VVPPAPTAGDQITQMSADPDVVASEVTIGELEPKPNWSPDRPTSARVGTPLALREYLNALRKPEPPPPWAVVSYTQPPSPGQAAGLPQTPPFAPMAATTSSAPPLPFWKPPRFAESSR